LIFGFEVTTFLVVVLVIVVVLLAASAVPPLVIARPDTTTAAINFLLDFIRTPYVLNQWRITSDVIR
jgi:hypothetical protein